MRLIDADRLLEERRIHLYYHLPNGDTAIPIIDIEKAPTVPHWIFVNELLPYEKERVVVYGSYPVYGAGGVVYRKNGITVGAVEDEKWHFDSFIGFEPIAWMKPVFPKIGDDGK